MKNRRNYYRILQVQPDAPIEVIRASYRTLMRELKQHPDLGGSAETSSLLNEAYGTLSDPKRRAEYDKELLAQYTKNPMRPASSKKRPLTTLICPFCRRPLARKAKAGERCPTCQIVLQSTEEAIPDQPRQRSIIRMKKSGSILYCSSWPQEPKKAKMVDLSPKGMRFYCSEKLEPGTLIKISGPLLEASAIVTNIHDRIEDGRRYYAVGVSFKAVDFEESKGFFFSLTV